MTHAKSIFLLFLPCVLLGAEKHDWTTGKLLDAQAAKTYFDTGSTTVAIVSGTTTGSVTAVVTGNSASSVGTATTSRNGTFQTRTHHMAIQSTQLLIIGGEYSYVVEDNVEKAVGPPLHGSLGRAIANRKHGCRYIVNDTVQYAQEKNKVFVTDADGKVCKLDLVRQERLQSVVSTPE